MPLKKCTVDGKPGWQWGAQGKCYTGPNAKKQAIKQGVAIEGPEKFSQKAVEQNISLDTKDIATVAEWMYDNGYDNAAVVATASTLSAYAASAKTKKEWDKIDKEELKRDTKKEKKEHEKDAIKDDKEKIKRLKKGDPSEKKKREVKDLKKDEQYDKKNAKSASDKRRQERLERDEDHQDKMEMDHESLRERLKHHKDAVKNLEREIKDLKKDKREDEKDVREESKGASDKRKQERLERDEYRQDKRELDHDSLHQRLQHHKDAIKHIEREIRDLKKDKREDEKDVRQESKGAKLTTSEKNNLPDSDFAYIAPGGKKVDGKTEPRSLRHLPIPDAAHVRNALARLNQTDISAAAKKEALRKIKSKAKELGIEVSESTRALYAGYRTTSMFMDRLGYGHFHTFTKGSTHTSKARTSFGDIIITGHTHDIVDGKIMAATDQEGHEHTHDIKDIGPGEGWVYGD